MRRTLLTLTIALLAIGTSTEPVAAVESSNFRTRMRSAEGLPAGVTVTVIETGNRLELVNGTDIDVTVLGYEDEPYLRVGPQGVFENVRSPASYLNRDRQATTAVPEDAEPGAPPEWRKLSSSRTARWYDHRVHWMGAILPPTVRQEQGERHVVIPEWTVSLRHGDRPFAVTGDLVWIPGPDSAPWLLLAVVPLGAAMLLVGASLWGGSRSWWPRRLAAAVLLLTMLTILSALLRTPPRLPPVLVVSWVTGAAGAALFVHRRSSGLVVAGLGAAGIAASAVLSLLSDLSRSQLPSRLPAGMARASVSVAIGLAAAVVCTGVLAWQRASRDDLHLLSGE